MNKTELLAKLGETLITEVRDEAIEKFEMIAAGKIKSKEAIDKNAKLKQFSDKQLDIIRDIVISSVDDVMHNLLWMFEQHEDEIGLFVSEDSKKENAIEISDGLAGEIYTDDGWIALYSKYKENY